MFPDTTLRDELYLLLIVLGASFLMISVAFAIYTLFLRVLNARKARFWDRLEMIWEPLLLEVLVQREPPQALWRCVEESEKLHFVDFVLRFARKLRGTEYESLCRLVQPFLAGLIEHLDKGDLYQRSRAVYTLGALAFRQYTQEILRALGDPAPLVVMVALRSLARRENFEFAPYVLEKIGRFGSWNIRFLASMIAEVGYEIAPLLRSRLMDLSEPKYVRIVCTEALLQLNDLGAGDLAETIIRTEEDPELLAANLRLLKRVGRTHALSSVRRLTHSPHMIVRTHALSVLGSIGSPEDSECLKSNLKYPSPWVVLHAARALKALGQLEILEQFSTTGHPRSSAALEVLGGVV